MGLYSEFEIVVPKPKCNIKSLFDEQKDWKFNESRFQYSYSNLKGLKVIVTSNEVLGYDFNELIDVVVKILKKHNERFHIEVKSNYFNI